MPPPATINNARPGKASSKYSRRLSVGRFHGRITKEDIRAAALRRWDGRARITTDWVNLYYEPELCFPDGDVLVYLRQPGQSSQGPAFRVHSAQLKARGFKSLLNLAVQRRSIHTSQECLLHSCPGCDKHASPSELYVPAPANAGLDATFDYHITTRNFFAWLYNLPLAGRALGKSLVALKERIDFYRDQEERGWTKKELMSYAENQRYLDFRECLDHALAALLFAQVLEEQNLWIDAFSHCVGMSHREMHASMEYPAIDTKTKILISQARRDMDSRLDRVRSSVEDFFEDDLSGNLLGLSQLAKDHFDRFRSYLHTFYIEQNGFWPPAGFVKDTNRWSVYTAMYSDFRNLYHHLVDANSSPDGAANDLSGTGGVCTLQNIQAFDNRHGYETLLRPLPKLPVEPTATLTKTPAMLRRRSWNPVAQKKQDKEIRNGSRVQALIDASNREMSIMDCALVQSYTEFETKCVWQNYEHLSLVEGRKIRWILIYAILQTLISVMQAPNSVRNAEGLTYSLCCEAPTKMPWFDLRKQYATEDKQEKQEKPEIEPDINYLHPNKSFGHDEAQPASPSRSNTLKKERRKSMPARTTSTSSQKSTAARSSSIRQLVRKKSPTERGPSPKQNQFCEILVHGYGNGLNAVNHGEDITALPDPEEAAAAIAPTVPPLDTILAERPKSTSTKSKKHEPLGTISISRPSSPKPKKPASSLPSRYTTGLNKLSKRSSNARTDAVPGFILSSNGSVSRESSNASSTSTWSSKGTQDSDTDIPTPTDKPRARHIIDLVKPRDKFMAMADLHFHNDVDEETGSIHINTKTWDEMLDRWQ